MDNTELDLREIFYMLRRRLWLLVALPAVAAVTAGILSIYFMNPVYSAATTLWVIKDGSGEITLSDLQLNRNLTKTYAEVARSRAVMTEAINRLGLSGITVAQMQQKVSATPRRDTELLEITIEDQDPVMAAKMADAVAAAFQTQIRTYMRVENVVVVDAAQVPTSPIKPRKTMNVAIALVLGAMAAVGITFLLEYLDDSVKTPEDVARHVGLPVLGIIPVIPAASEVAPVAQGRRQKAVKASTGVK